MDESFSVREKLVGAFLILMGLIAVLTLLVIAQGKGWFLTYKTYRIKFKQGYHLH